MQESLSVWLGESRLNPMIMVRFWFYWAPVVCRHNLILKLCPSVFHFSCQSGRGYTVVAMLIPQLHGPHRTLGDTSDDLHGSGRLFAAATSKSLMGDLFVAGRIAFVRLESINNGVAVMVQSTPNPSLVPRRMVGGTPTGV